MRKLIKLFLLFVPITVFASDNFRPSDTIEVPLQNTATDCSSQVLANAIQESAHTINEADSRQAVKNWIYDVFQSPEVLGEVLSCPEIADAEDDTVIKFMPIKYIFPHGREIVINYQTQVKILHQYFNLATKTELPTNDPNPEISPIDPTATWVNTDPAWYAIMVTRHGALNEFVGPGKNNTVSFKWIADNINSLYPIDADGVCSTRSGIGAKLNDAMVHNVIHEKTARHDGDKNNYYVAGDIDLRWVSYAEVAFDIALSAATWGASTAATGALKGARATRTMGNLAKNMKRLTKVDKVKDYVRTSVNVAKAQRRVENITKVEKSLNNISKIEKRLAKATKGTKQFDRLSDELRAAQKLHADTLAKMGTDAKSLSSINDMEKLADMRKASNKDIEEMQKVMEKMAKENEDVAEYVKNFDALKDVNQYAKDLRAIKKPQTGNVATRTWQSIKNARTSIKAAYTGTKKLNRASKVARHSMKSGRVRDLLFHATRRNLARLTRVTSDIAVLSFVVGLIGDFYDRTEISNDEFTNGIEMKPLLLLSADDIEEQDNIVNYGMWLMWQGDSTSPEDDDAAYLQASDFAQKFYQDLIETQDESGKNSCDVDIYVVRPIIRNPDTPGQSLYWLVMNEEPWSTAPADTY